MRKLGKALEYGMTVASIALMVWIGASFVDVVADNSTTAQHADWNAFVIMTELAK